MKKRVLCVIGDQFEEIETVAPVDILRRAGAEVIIASVTGSLLVTGRTNIKLQADALLEQAGSVGEYDCILLPGGPGVRKLRTDARVVELIRNFHQQGKIVAAICAAPLLLNDAGILRGRRYTAHYSVVGELPDARLGEPVVEDGNVITSRGAGTSVHFGLAIVRKLFGDSVANDIAQSIMV